MSSSPPYLARTPASTKSTEESQGSSPLLVQFCRELLSLGSITISKDNNRALIV